MARIKRTIARWGFIDETGSIRLDSDARKGLHEFPKAHINTRVKISYTVENNDFDLAWLRFFRGVVVRIICRELLGNETQEDLDYLHELLKQNFFPEKIDPVTGLSERRSMAKIGNIGKTDIINAFPAIQKWAVENHNIIIPSKGEFYDESTGEMFTYDIGHERAVLNGSNNFEEKGFKNE